MHDWGITYGLVLIVILASIASVGWDMFEMRNRESWWWTGILMLEVLLMPNLWMAAILASIIIGLFQIGKSWFILRTLVIPVAGLAGAYIGLAPYMHPGMIAPILWAGVFVGCALGAWGLFGVYKPERPWQYALPKGWWGFWGIYEHGTGTYYHLCGQGNTMHLVGVSSLSVACAVGLGLMGQWWAYPAALLCLAPLVLVYLHQSNRHPGQGVLNMCVLASGVMLLQWPLVGLTILGLGTLTAIGIVLHAKPWNQTCSWWDSGRFPYWRDVITLVWWPNGWRSRLFGFGTGSWFIATIRMGEERKHPAVFTMAHNEYVQQLVEHGIVGLVVMVGYMAEALWRTANGGIEGQAVFLIGLVMCSICLVNFPLAWFHEYHPRNVQQEQWFGSPTLNAWAFVVALLVEAF